jgi:hypothetical protein
MDVASAQATDPARPVNAGISSLSDDRGRLSATHPSGVGNSRQDPLGEI